MKTDSDLEQIVDTIRTGYQLRSETIGTHVTLLRSIQIDALRHAREMFAPIQVFNVKTDDFEEMLHPALTELDKLIRELELR